MAIAAALAGFALVLVVAREGSSANQLATKLAPYAFGAAGFVAFVSAILSAWAWQRDARHLTEVLESATSWDGLAAAQTKAAWWPQLLRALERQRKLGLEPDVHGWLDRTRRHIGHGQAHAAMVSVLIVVGIVFTFDGIRRSTEQLTAILRGSGTGHDAAQLGKSIGGALEPLKDAFGANLVGIVLSIALLLLAILARRQQKRAAEDVEEFVLDVVEPVLRADHEASVRAQRTAEADSRWQRLLEHVADQQDATGSALAKLDESVKASNDHLTDIRLFTESTDATMKNHADLTAMRLSENLAPMLREQLQPTLDQLRTSLEKIAAQTQGTASETASQVATGIASQIREGYDQALDALRLILVELNVWADTNRTAMVGLSSGLERAAGEQQKSFEQAQLAFDRLREVLPGLQELVQRLDAIVGTTHQIIQQGEAGSQRAVESQRTASEALASNSTLIASALQRMQEVPGQVEHTASALAQRVEQMLQASDKEAMKRAEFLESAVQRVAQQQETVSAQTANAVREFSTELTRAVSQAVEAARAGLGGAGEHAANQLHGLLAKSSEDVQATASNLESALSGGVDAMRESFEALQTEMRGLAGSLQTQSQDQYRKMEALAGQLGATTQALETMSGQARTAVQIAVQQIGQLDQALKLTVQQSGDDFRQRVGAAVATLHAGVDKELSEAVGLLASGATSLESSAKSLQRAADRWQETARA